MLLRRSAPRGLTAVVVAPQRATCVIGKPGPGVVAEAAVCGVPFVTERRAVMPQARSREAARPSIHPRGLARPVRASRAERRAAIGRSAACSDG